MKIIDYYEIFDRHIIVSYATLGLEYLSTFKQGDKYLISTFTEGARRLTRKQVTKLAKFYNVSDEELLTLWLSNKLLDTIENEPFAMQGLNKAKTILQKH